MYTDAMNDLIKKTLTDIQYKKYQSATGYYITCLKKVSKSAKMIKLITKLSKMERTAIDEEWDEKVKGWDRATKLSQRIGFKCHEAVVYQSKLALSGAMCCLGEITQVTIDEVYSDGSCFISVTDGWSTRIISERMQLDTLNTDIGKYFNTDISDH
jgi:hypothetical protein